MQFPNIRPQYYHFSSSYKFLQTLMHVADPFSLLPDLPNYSPSKIWDPSRLVANALVYRHFYKEEIASSIVGELVDP